jgi:hypothetical protein
MSGSGGDACRTGGQPRGYKRSKEAAIQGTALERGARGIEVLAAATQKRIKLAAMALRIESEKAVVNSAVEAFKPPSSMPANVRKLLQHGTLKGVSGFDEAGTSSAAPTPCASEKRVDMDDAGNGDDAVDLSEGRSEQKNKE